MRQGLLSIARNQSSSDRTLRMKRNRQIRKQKLYGKSFFILQAENTCPHKDEKVHIQKLKNRQAAQKSRQQRKFYVTQLQDQIRELKQKLRNLQYCQNCQKQLQISPSQIQNTNQSTFSRQQVEIGLEQSQFVRMSSTDQNSSIGIYLFVFMIILGIFCVGSRVDSQNGFDPLRRDLTQLYSVPGNTQSGLIQQKLIYQNNERSTYSTDSQIDLNSKNYQNGLLSMDQVKSPSHIADQKTFEKIITSFENYKMDKYDDKNLRSKNGLIDANKSLMFCSRPKIYRSDVNDKGIFTAFIDIFVKGAQIINIFPQVGQNPDTTGNFQLNGLYKITASVQEIQEIANQNFIY